MIYRWRYGCRYTRSLGCVCMTESLTTSSKPGFPHGKKQNRQGSRVSIMLPVADMLTCRHLNAGIFVHYVRWLTGVCLYDYNNPIAVQFWINQIIVISDHVNSNRVFLLDNQIYPIMRNQINTLSFFHNTLPACTPINLIYFGPLCNVRFLIIPFLGCQNRSGHVNGPTDNLNALSDISHLNAEHISSGVSRSDSRLQLSSFCTF